ncbi:MAG: hypothetical protein JWM68_4689, partial [Verrucomicrobiales bacterium]|nr:hypothetical protein [Verrucomicrobiales bacterium]
AYVPFILLSQALLIDGEMAIELSVAASVLVVLRFSQLRKYFGGMNFPPRLLALGGVLLVINVMLPMLARHIHSGSVALDRVERMNYLVRALWLFGTPLLAGIAYFLPTPRTIGSHLLQRRTFPLTALGLWVFVTAAHLYCIGYIHESAWNIAMTTPLLWAAAWMFYVRMGDVFEKPGMNLRNFLMLPAGAITLLAAYQHQWSLFFVLNILNVFIYGTLVIKQRSSYVFRLMSLAACAVLAGIPNELIAQLDLDFSRGALIGLGITSFVLLQTLLSRDPSAGVLGALVAGIATAVFFEGNSYYVNVATQVGAAFFLIHSLRWAANIAGSQVARLCAAGVWVIHSIFWTASTNITAVWTTACFALAVFTIYFAVRAIFGIWGSRVVPYAAALVLLSSPVQRLLSTLQSTPTGLLVLIASFSCSPWERFSRSPEIAGRNQPTSSQQNLPPNKL